MISLVPPPSWILIFTQALQPQPNGSCNPQDRQPRFSPNRLQSSLVASLFPVLGLDFKTLISIDSNTLIICDIFSRRVQQAQDGFPHLMFEANNYGCLTSPTAQLNDICINGCSALLYSQSLSLNAAQCAILSTHDLPRV